MMSSHLPSPTNMQQGFTLIEILITLVITAFGLLALAGFVTKATTLTADSTQRARAGVLLNDMASRIANHKAIADTYVTGIAYGAAPTANCNGKAAGAELDLCEWNNLLAGANDGGGSAAALGYRGCITKPSVVDPVYIITVAWGSLTPGVPPPDSVTCGAKDFGESHRRIIRSQVYVAALTT